MRRRSQRISSIIIVATISIATNSSTLPTASSFEVSVTLVRASHTRRPSSAVAMKSTQSANGATIGDAQSRTHSADAADISNEDEDGMWDIVPTKKNLLKNERSTLQKQQQHRGGDAQHAKQFATDLASSIETVEPTQENIAFKPFMVMMCGLPGSGKSTLARALVQTMPFKFVRINQDELGNRRACEAMCRQTIHDGKCPIIDRCNFDLKQRQKWIDIARAEFPNATAAKSRIYVVQFDLPDTVCVQRCKTRGEHETIQPRQAQRIVGMVKKDLRFPSSKEKRNYRQVYNVQDATDLQNALSTIANHMD
eukprot:CAMPEP_0198123698 /NCGR_PEP_ID=MMETSP1442-20131203/38128_1 /TAXON_ID= /ORGANISM="Craspedostauros australis, Strain CCMP3328" /LENGTH=309 /DNA_ID=CAMNT_0043782941 /DNA_START=53 /DNA_END=982 /DNA_ORIENTATION=-